MSERTVIRLAVVGAIASVLLAAVAVVVTRSLPPFDPAACGLSGSAPPPQPVIASQLPGDGWAPSDVTSPAEVLSPLLAGLEINMSDSHAHQVVQVCYASILTAPSLRVWTNPGAFELTLFTEVSTPDQRLQAGDPLLLVLIQASWTNQYAAYMRPTGVSASGLVGLGEYVSGAINSLGQIIPAVDTAGVLIAAGLVGYTY